MLCDLIDSFHPFLISNSRIEKFRFCWLGPLVPHNISNVWVFVFLVLKALQSKATLLKVIMNPSELLAVKVVIQPRCECFCLYWGCEYFLGKQWTNQKSFILLAFDYCAETAASFVKMRQCKLMCNTECKVNQHISTNKFQIEISFSGCRILSKATVNRGILAAD